MTTRRGRFITLEGIDGAGKSTQAKLLADFIKEKGHAVFLSREPGGSAAAEKVRELLTRRQAFSWHPKSEALLHYAARLEHCRHTLIPKIEEGEWVICDRFADSTFAYQGAGQGVETEFLEYLHRSTIGDFSPDQTFILDISPKIAIDRSNPLLLAQLHYENMGEDFFRRVRRGYKEIAAKNPQRCTLISANGDVEDVQRRIRRRLRL